MIGPRAERTLVTGAALKQIVLALGELVVLAIAIWQLVEGRWAVALGVLVIGGLVAYIVLDVLTGLLLLPFVGAAAVTDRRGQTDGRQELLDEPAANDFARTVARWERTYSAADWNPFSKTSPGRRGDVEAAIRVILNWRGYELEPVERPVMLKGSIAAGGYLWRDAEPYNSKDADSLIEPLVRSSLVEREKRSVALAFAAKECVVQRVPLWLNSPGGLATGASFLPMGLEHVIEAIDKEALSRRGDEAFLFLWGVALHDCERIMDVIAPDSKIGESAGRFGAGMVREHEAGEAERLWAARPAAEFLSFVADQVASERREETETALRNVAYSDAKRLDLSGSRTTDADLASFPAMPALKDLGLAGATISDAGLAHLSELKRLEELDLAQTAITGEGLAHLAALPITRLDLRGSAIQDEHLGRLSALTHLEVLWLNKTAITDAGLQHLLAVPTLKELDLSDTAVTDAGLARLLEHPNLGTVYARRTKVTEAMSERWLDGKQRVVMLLDENEEATGQAEADQRLADERLEEVQALWLELSSQIVPDIDPDLAGALHEMGTRIGQQDEASYEHRWKLGAAGYAWRRAEQHLTSHARELVRKVVASEFNPAMTRPHALTFAASNAIAEGVPLGWESPGGFIHGDAFLERGFRFALSVVKVPPGSRATDDELQAAFWFGLALHDVEPIVDELRGERSG